MNGEILLDGVFLLEELMLDWGIVFQKYFVFFYLSVEENLILVYEFEVVLMIGCFYGQVWCVVLSEIDEFLDCIGLKNVWIKYFV